MSIIHTYPEYHIKILDKTIQTEKIINEEVLRGMGTGKEIARQFKTRNLQYIGHLISHISPKQQLIEGKIEGRGSRGDQETHGQLT